MRYSYLLWSLGLLLLACSGLGVERHFVLDPPAHNLRGHDANGKDDLPESDCDPVKKPDGTFEYKCIVHFIPDYKAMLLENDRLKKELGDCQKQCKP